MKLVKSEKGMSLIEIIISLAILGIVSSGIIIFFINSFKFQARIQEISKAQKLADAVMEDIKNGNIDKMIFVDYDGNYDGDLILEEVDSAGKIIKVGSEIDDEYNVSLKVYELNYNSYMEVYDFEVRVESKYNSSIAGMVRSTVRQKIGANRNSVCRITYVKRIIGGDEDLFSEDFFGKGTYNVNPFVPGEKFEGWQIDGSGPLYGYTDEASTNQIEITESLSELTLVASFE